MRMKNGNDNKNACLNKIIFFILTGNLIQLPFSGSEGFSNRVFRNIINK